MRGRSAPAWPFFVLLVMAMAARLVFAHFYSFPLQGDAGHYYWLARHLIENGYYGVNSVPDSVRPPFYPAVLAVLAFLFDGDVSVRLATGLNCVLDGFSLFFLWRIGRRVQLPLALYGIGYVALSPMWFGTVNVMVTEPLSITLFLWFADLWTDGKRGSMRAAGMGLLLGALTLTRSMFLFFPFALILAGLVESRWIRKSRDVKVPGRDWLVLLVFAYLPPVLWSFRNFALFGQFQVTQPGVSIPMLWETIKMPLLDFRTPGTLQQLVALPLFRELQAAKDAVATQAVLDRMVAEVWQFVREHPFDYLALLGPKTLRLWVTGWANPYPYGITPRVESVWYLILFVVPTLILGTIGLISRLGRRMEAGLARLSILQILGVLYVTGVTLPLTLDARYSIIPLVCFGWWVPSGIRFLLSLTPKRDKMGRWRTCVGWL